MFKFLSKRKGTIKLLEITNELQKAFVIMHARNADEDITWAVSAGLASGLKSSSRLYTLLNFHAGQEDLTVFVAWIGNVIGPLVFSGVMY